MLLRLKFRNKSLKIPLVAFYLSGGTERNIQGLLSPARSWRLKGRGNRRCSPCTYLELRLGTAITSGSFGPYLSVFLREGFGIWVGLLWLNCWSSLNSVEFLQFNHWSTAQIQTINPNGISWEIWMISSEFGHLNMGFLWENFKSKLNIFKNWTFEWYSKKFRRLSRINCWLQWWVQQMIWSILSIQICHFMHTKSAQIQKQKCVSSRI